ncbi:MAG: hybrid sensor histidine kinase/response regulator [bacterium]
MNHTHRVLVVDDEEKVLEFLESVLVSQGYEVIKARDGKDAIAKVREMMPDIVLLDVMMPVIDGFEVCKRLKREIEYLPIIMITALDDKVSRIRAIECGADDILIKSRTIFTELKLKVRNTLKTKDLYCKLKESYTSLKEIEELRDNLMDFIIHDMRAPLTSIKGYLDLINKSRNIKGQDKTDMEKVSHSVELMVSMISDLLCIKRMEKGEMEIHPDIHEFTDIIETVFEMMQPLAKEKGVHLYGEVKQADVRLNVQRDLIERVMRNILDNAIRYTPNGGKVGIKAGPGDKCGYVTVSISDTGKGIPKGYHEIIFDKFKTVGMRKNGNRSSTGLGLTFCKLAVELHGGKIWIEDGQNGEGAVFKFTLPSLNGSAQKNLMTQEDMNYALAQR